MSGEGPESIPTSADPRSHRPTKKRALTPVSAQAASVDALFARPDQPVRLPPSSTDLAASRRHAPPEIVTNVQGSSAGAGSGEFHVYKASRRREYERLREMDEQVRRDRDKVDFEREKVEREKRDEEKTRKNRERREKMKARKAKKGKGDGKGEPKAQPVGKGIKPNVVVARRELGDEGEDDGDQREPDTRMAEAGDGGAKASPSAEQPAGLIIHDED